MTDNSGNNLNPDLRKLTIQSFDTNDDSSIEATTPDSSSNYLPESYSCEKITATTLVNQSNNSTTNTENAECVTSQNSEDINYNNRLQIPIVGYEIMEERAKFTVYKLRIENASGDCWYVFRRYTDFVRLCSKLKHSYPSLTLLIPRKKYFGNNFDPNFLTERAHGLQAFINAVISIPELLNTNEIKNFFCLNDPPAYSDTSDESRAICEALEDTIYQLRHELQLKNAAMQDLVVSLEEHSQELQRLRDYVKNSSMRCNKCLMDLNVNKGEKST